MHRSINMARRPFTEPVNTPFMKIEFEFDKSSAEGDIVKTLNDFGDFLIYFRSLLRVKATSNTVINISFEHDFYEYIWYLSQLAEEAGFSQNAKNINKLINELDNPKEVINNLLAETRYLQALYDEPPICANNEVTQYCIMDNE